MLCICTTGFVVVVVVVVVVVLNRFWGNQVSIFSRQALSQLSYLQCPLLYCFLIPVPHLTCRPVSFLFFNMKYTFPQLPAHQAIEMDQREMSLPHKPEPLCSMPWTPNARWEASSYKCFPELHTAHIHTQINNYYCYYYYLVFKLEILANHALTGISAHLTLPGRSPPETTTKGGFNGQPSISL